MGIDKEHVNKWFKEIIIMSYNQLLQLCTARTGFLYARLKNGRIMLYPSASVRRSVGLSVRPSVNFFVSV